MTNKNNLEIIKQKGIGKYLGERESNSEEINKYELYIQFCSEGEDKYLVNLFANPNLCSLQILLYSGQDKNKAEEIYNMAVEKDKKIKQNLANKLFDEN